jgi:DNA-binding transcriptional regulator LsrR (DeoR family)
LLPETELRRSGRCASERTIEVLGFFENVTQTQIATPMGLPGLHVARVLARL